MELPEGVGPEDLAKVEFYYPKKGSGDTQVGAHLFFQGVELMAMWSDTPEGGESFHRLIGSLPGIIAAAKRERDIRYETGSLDAELANFLGSDE